MRYGNWIPLDKALAGSLPTNRPFTKLEAMYSMTVDYDNGTAVSVAGMATRWGWNRKTVRRFLEIVGVKITYEHDTEKKQNQKGQIQVQIRDRSEMKKGQIRFINSKDIDYGRDTSKGNEGQIRDRSRDATINPKKPDPEKAVEKTSASRHHVPVKEIVEYLNEKTSRSYRPETSKTQALVKARFREGFSIEDFRMVIDRKAGDWLKNPEMAMYLRPETLFGPKFEGYLQSVMSQGTASQSCSLCRYNQVDPCSNLGLPGFNPASCDAFRRVEVGA